MATAAAAAAVAGQRERGGGDAGVTLEGAELASGASICFFRAGERSAVRRTYNAAIEGLVEEMEALLMGEGPLGRVHLIKVKIVSSVSDCIGRQTPCSWLFSIGRGYYVFVRGKWRRDVGYCRRHGNIRFCGVFVS